MSADLLLFALGTSRELGTRVAAGLGAQLAAHEEREFEDGEHKARPLVSVRGRDAFVLHSLHGDARHSVDVKLCRLLFFVAALKDAGAARITVVAPYLAYARKDRRTKPRDPVTIRYVAQLLEAVGTDQVVALDVHNLAAFENAFRCPTVHLTARRLILRHVGVRLHGQRLCVMSPDFGGIKRVEDFLDGLREDGHADAGLAFMEKRRSKGVVSGEQVVGDVEGRNVLILDDLISTGGTMLRAARAALERGALSVQVAATHGVFTPGAETTLADAALHRIVVTNSIAPERLAGPARDRLAVLDIAGLLAEAIRRLHEGGSIVELLETWPPGEAPTVSGPAAGG